MKKNKSNKKTRGSEQEFELSALKTNFLSIASHEFKTPLAGILSSLNLINRYLDADHQAWCRFRNKEKVENHLNKINESVKNLNTILDKFLALGNIEKGEIPVSYIHFNLKKFLNTQRSQFQQTAKPGQKINYLHRGKETNVFLDKYLFRNIMNNLLSNAIKFSHENSEIQLISEITNDAIIIEVRDQGIGIPREDQDKIFSRFFRAANAVSYQEGTGLGLSIVKNYVGLLDGQITFESRQHQGTIFCIRIPARKDEKDTGH